MPAASPPDTLEAALAAVFDSAEAKTVSWSYLPGGGRLFGAGEPADTLYLLRAGRLGVFKKEEGKETQFVGIIRPGEPVGEMALIAGTPHTSTVIALRDSEVLALPRDAFFRAARKMPEVMTELARLMILRARQGAHEVADPTVLGFIGVSEAPVRPLVEAIAAETVRAGFSVKVVDSTALKSAGDWFSAIEETHDYVFYVGEKSEASWSHLVARQVDRMYLVGRGGEAPPAGLPWDHDPLGEHRLVDLILTWPAGRRPSGAKAWIDRVDPARWFHLADGDPAGPARISRVVTGTSVGVVLSGGGARAFAHIGAVKALRQAGVPMDFLAGASMGSIIAATLGLGWDDDEIDWRMRKAFVESSPLDDIAFPLLAMTAGRKVDARLEEHFGDVQIEDMPNPYFCVSSNLTTGAYQVHRRGLLRQALRASISLPGVMPPVVLDGHVLVDGAVMKSFPADLMRATHLGTTVGVDVTRARGVDPRVLSANKSWVKWLTSGDWRRGPPIVSILMRSATITTAADLAESRRATDLLVIPKPDGVEIRDWKAYPQAVQTGFETMQEALAQLDGPVTTLRRRQVAYHPNEPIITIDDVPSETIAETETASLPPRLGGKTA